MKIKAAILALVAGLVATPAFAAKVEFQGAMVLQKVSVGCGLLPYMEQSAVYRMSAWPAGVGSNGSATAFTIKFSDIMVSSIVSPTGTPTNTFVSVQVTSIVEDLSLNFDSFMRINKQTPATLKSSTKFVAMIGEIRDFNGVEGCNVSFRAGLTRT